MEDGERNGLDVHIGRLRHRIEAESADSYITTVRGVGFRFATEDDLMSSPRHRRPRSVSARQRRAG